MSDVERIKDAIRIEQYIGQYVEFKGNARHLKACCPFHSEHTPSFVVDPEYQSWKCWGACAEGGDVIAFAMKYHNLTFGEALEELARYAGITLTPLSAESKARDERREYLYALMEEAANYYDALLYTGGPHLDYLTKTRGLSEETIKQSSIGYAPGNMILYKQMTQLGYTFQDLLDCDLIKQGGNRPYDTFSNRIVIPMRDNSGRVVGFSGRAMSPDHGPKYLNTAKTEIFNKGSLIYTPISRVKNRQGKVLDALVVVEGHMDAISAYNRGFHNVVSQMGTSLTEIQFSLLCKMGATRIVFCLDNDIAGQTATKRLGETHLQTAARLGVELYVMSAPFGKDPDDTFREKPELWQPAVDAARPLVDVLIGMSIGANPQSMSATTKTAIVKKMMSFLRNDNPLITSENLGKLAAALSVSVNDLETMARSPLFTIVARNDKPKPVTSHLPTIEEWVLHGIIANDDDGWLERANACLLIASPDHLPYALAPLSLNDFKQDKTKKVWAMIAEYVKEGYRPVYDPLEAYVKDTPMQEQYERLRRLDIAARECGYPCEVSYETFIDNVYQLRITRLKEELPGMQSEALRSECLKAIACLTLCQEELI